jgi:2-polyprenyl-6-methoxyphenol hydroxylase-like FAD-dependent oxidoreductase
MKVVILGGGIAGLTAGAFFHRNGIETVVHEKRGKIPDKGQAFLLHPDAMAILKKLTAADGTVLAGKPISRFSLCKSTGEEIRSLPLVSWQCIKRRDILRTLYSLFPAGMIREGSDFSHFVYEDDRIVAAAFSGGEIEYGDIFIGADGVNSRVRGAIFDTVNMTPVRVKEVVGICRHEKIARQYPDTFVKYQDDKKGLAFGLIPVFENEFVWFMQYDPSIGDVPENKPSAIRDFCGDMLGEFPSIVRNLLAANDFSKTYIWKTKDFDLLPAFHHKNVVLLGDAAHLTLPFASAGTTDAIIDAKTLVECLESSNNTEKGFEAYYRVRAREIERHILLGRRLQHAFLNPCGDGGEDIAVPLIGVSVNRHHEFPKHLSVKLT